MASLRDSDRAESWVYGIARRAIADYYRARGRRMQLESAADVDETPGTPTDVHEEVLSWIRPFAEGLPEGYREALVMADFEGRSQKEVAQALGLSLPGAKSRIQRARRMLGEQLRRCCELHFGSDGRVTDIEPRDCDCR